VAKKKAKPPTFGQTWMKFLLHPKSMLAMAIIGVAAWAYTHQKEAINIVSFLGTIALVIAVGWVVVKKVFRH
jgi:peptidoglycan biosynthesis protein MviN/MurJ (putative lipid II flippase)